MSLTDDIRPHLASDGVPMCDDACPSYDGKRCRVLGLRPGNICEPAVAEMVADLANWKEEAKRLGIERDAALSRVAELLPDHVQQSDAQALATREES